MGLSIQALTYVIDNPLADGTHGLLHAPNRQDEIAQAIRSLAFKPPTKAIGLAMLGDKGVHWNTSYARFLFSRPDLGQVATEKQIAKALNLGGMFPDSDTTKALVTSPALQQLIEKTVASSDFEVTPQVATLGAKFWNSRLTKAIFQNSNVGKEAYGILFQAATKNRKTQTTHDFLYNSKIPVESAVRLMENDFPITRDDVLFVKEDFYPLAVALYRHPRLKEACGDELFYKLCQEAMLHPEDSNAGSLARNAGFPIGNLQEYEAHVQNDQIPYTDPIELALFKPNSAFARGLGGNPNFPIEHDLVKVLSELRSENNGKPTEFELGVYEHPSVRKS